MVDMPRVRALLAEAGYDAPRIEAGVAYACSAGAVDGEEGLSLALARILFTTDDLGDGTRFGVEPGSLPRPTLH